MEPWQDAVLYFAFFSLLGLLILVIVAVRRPSPPIRIRLVYTFAPFLAFLAAFAAVPLLVTDRRLRIPIQLAVFLVWFAVVRSRSFRDRAASAALRAELRRPR